MREQFRKLHEDLDNFLLQMSLANPERWNGLIKKYNEQRPEVPFEMPYQEMLKLARDKKLKTSLTNEYHLLIEQQLVRNTTSLLFKRNWALVLADENSGPFITTDDPVFIDYSNPGKIPLLLRNSPGFGAMETVVLFPVTQNLLLSGEFDGPSGIAGASQEITAQSNSAAIRRATRQIYAPSAHFFYLDKNLILRDGNFLHDYIRRKESRSH